MILEMRTANIISYTETQTIIRCPYCNKQHKHGNGGSKTAEGQTRMAHCPNGGEYKIVMNGAPFETKGKFVVYFD